MWYKGWDEFRIINMLKLMLKLLRVAIPIETDGAAVSIHNECW